MYELQIEFASLTDTFNQKLVHQEQKRCWKLTTNVILQEEDVGIEREQGYSRYATVTETYSIVQREEH